MAVRKISGKITVNAELCSGCRLCEVICSQRHEGKVWPERSRVRVSKDERNGLDIPLLCRQCEDAPCVEACSTKAIIRNKSTGAIVLQDGCEGCGTCARACEYGAIFFEGESRKPLICDLCNGEPACVEKCVVQALQHSTTAGKKIKARARAITMPHTGKGKS